MTTSYPDSKLVYNPKTQKKETKTEWKTHLEERNEFIERFGEEEFNKIAKSDENWAKLQFLPIPAPFNWLFGHFQRMYRYAPGDGWGGKIFGPAEINEYCKCFKVDFNIEEKHLLLQIKDWAVETIAELRKSD